MLEEVEPDGSGCHSDRTETRQQFPSVFAPGALVSARDAPWRVVASLQHEDCQEIRLYGDEGDRVLLSPFDRILPLRDERRVRLVSRRRWARTVAALLRDSRSPARLHVSSSDAEILPHQLDPALAIAGGACRLLLADEVGLGKTVQAGWIIADLVARERDPRVLVCLPAGLALQWRDELYRFFGIVAPVADARWLRRRIAGLPADVNPWCLPGIYLVSIDFIKRGDVRASLAGEPWDLLVVDEAHGAAAPTDRHAALAALAQNARRIVLVTATPMSGNIAAFQSLISLGGIDQTPPPIYRRSRESIGTVRLRTHRFTLVRLADSEVRLQRELERYTRTVWRANDAGAPRLAMTILRKRALSSPAAVARSLRRRAALLATTLPWSQQLTLFDEQTDPADEEPAAVLAAPGLDNVERERRWLDALATLADAAGRADSKQRFLGRLLARFGPANSAIVFTEYRDTLWDLASRFTSSLQLHGGLAPAERDAVQRRFNAEGGLLLATDAAAEGLNLQQRCRIVINYELPWNPARLEQRIGRVDRIGQARRVHAISLVARDTAEDLVVANLLTRLARIACNLGSRDRLAAFLDDARVAREVIGGVALDLVPAPPAISTPPIATISAAALSAAQHLHMLRRLSVRDARRADGEIAVCRVHRSETVPSGTLFVIEWRAMSRDGRAVAANVVPVHVASTLDPRSVHVLRGVACAAREQAAALLATAVAASKSARHELLTRERQFGTARVPIADQPGLFDRATPHLDAARGGDRERHEQIERRLARLNDDTNLHSVLRLAGVLFVGAGPR